MPFSPSVRVVEIGEQWTLILLGPTMAIRTMPSLAAMAARRYAAVVDHRAATANMNTEAVVPDLSAVTLPH